MKLVAVARRFRKLFTAATRVSRVNNRLFGRAHRVRRGLYDRMRVASTRSIRAMQRTDDIDRVTQVGRRLKRVTDEVKRRIRHVDLRRDKRLARVARIGRRADNRVTAVVAAPAATAAGIAAWDLGKRSRAKRLGRST